MKEISHPAYGPCYELTDYRDIDRSRKAQAALVNQTILPSGTKTLDENLWFRDTYLVLQEHAPAGAPLP